jgi:hypothetical protein
VKSVAWWTVVREWFKRVVLRANDRSATRYWFEELFSYTDMDEEVQVSEQPALTPAVLEALSRQLNALTPWHVRVDIESRPGGTGVRCRSRIGFDASGSGVGGGASDGPPLHYLLHVLHGVQSFMVRRTNRAWPARERLTKEGQSGGDLETYLLALPLPDGIVQDGEAQLWYGERDRPALELEPIPLR